MNLSRVKTPYSKETLFVTLKLKTNILILFTNTDCEVKQYFIHIFTYNIYQFISNLIYQFILKNVCKLLGIYIFVYKKMNEITIINF